MKKITFLMAFFAIILFNPSMFSQTGTIDFNTADGTNLGAIAEDGEGGSSDISGVVFNIFLINSSGAATGSDVFFDQSGGGYEGLSSTANPGSSGFKGMALKTVDGSEFDFNGFNASEYGFVTTTFKVEGFRDGISIGSTTVLLNGFDVETYTSASFSDITFGNVDEIRITENGGQDIFGTMDAFVVGTPVILDTTPPVFENSTPTESSITQTGFTLETDIDEAGTIYYVVVPDGAAAPNSAEVKSGTGSGGSGQVTSGNTAVSTGGFTNNFNVLGLTLATAYDVYVVAEDDEGTPNLQASPTKIDVTTSAPIALTITGLTGDNKEYDDTTAGTATGTASLSGVVGGDDVNLGGTPVFTFASANVGTGITINTTGYTISGADAGNYTLTQPTLSANITTKELTITGITGNNKVYDGTTAANASGTASLSGVVSGDDVTLSGAPSFTFASVNVGSGITINSTGFTISGTDSGNYTLTQPTLSADITAASLTVAGLTGDNKEYDGTTPASATGPVSLAGVIGADDVTLGGSPFFNFVNANVGTGITVNGGGFTISGTDSGNYTLTQPIISADITSKSLIITGIIGNNKVYDGTTAATATGTAALTGVVPGDNITLSGSPSFTFASANVGTGISIATAGYILSGVDVGNYTLIQPTLSADITGQVLTITGLTGDDKAYDGTTVATATGTASLSGVVAGDDVTLSGAPVFTFASANVGTGITINSSGYTISGTDSGNYTLTQPTLSGDITGQVLTITGLTGDNKTYDGTTAATASGSATLSGVAAGDDVTLGGTPSFTFASANVGTGITINSTGFTISGTDSGNYTLTQPTLSGDITSVSLTITGLTGDNKAYDGTTAATASGSATLSGVAAGDDVTLSGSPSFTFASANVGTGITINSSGFTISGTDSGNYTLTQPTLSADITGQVLTITGLTGNDKTYDGTTAANASGTASLSGLAAGDDVTLGGSPSFTFANANVGTGITINSSGYTISGTDSGNYTLTQPTLSADITSVSLTITGLTGDNKTYDGTTAATATGTASLSGVAAGDDVTLGGSPSFTFASANVGTGITINTTGYTISGVDSGNYTLTQPTLSADITSVSLTITGLTGDNKAYDGTTAANASGTASLSGLAAGDDVTLGGSPVFTFASANVGTGITINTTGYTISGTDSGNYTLTQPTLSADITSVSLTITGLTGDNKAFDGTTNATASGVASLSGVIGADDVTLGGSPVYTFASAAVGTGIAITTTGYTISGTDAGNYTLTQPTLSADITGDALTLDDISITDETCDGAGDGSASVTVSGGTAPYSYEWSTGVTTTGNVLSGLDDGDYSVTVVDALNNFVMQDFTIAEGTTIEVTLTEDQTVYYGYPPASNTTIGVEQIVGGTAPYTYVWSTGETTENIHVCPTDTTTYTVTVTDANGCSTTADVVVNVVDVRCNHGHHGHYGRKHFVKVCHKGRKTICLPWWAAKWHLWHGDTLGGCDSEPNQVEITNLRVFPNPFKRHLHVKFNSTATADVDLLIYNHRGTQVFQRTLTVHEGQTKIKLNLSHLKRGRYYLKAVVNGEVKRTRHLIKH